MHRHGYKGRKFGRERDQRNALTRGLIQQLFEHQAITTTLPKAKEIRRPAEKLITLAKKGGLSERRRIIAKLGNNVALGHKLVDQIAPAISRNSGYLRVVKLDELRVGDGAEMARIEFVDLDAIQKNLSNENSAETAAAAKKTETEKTPRPAAKKSDNQEKSTEKSATKNSEKGDD